MQRVARICQRQLLLVVRLVVQFEVELAISKLCKILNTFKKYISAELKTETGNLSEFRNNVNNNSNNFFHGNSVLGSNLYYY